MNKFLVSLVLFFTLITSVYSVPLDTFQTFSTANPTTSRRGQWVQLMARGSGTNDFYVLEVDPVTGAIPVSATFTLGNDTNYGVVGNNTLRTAAQIGNATGAASFGAGTTSAQTLRVVLPTDQSAIPVTQSGTWNINNISGTVSLPTGAATETTLSAINGKLNTLGQKTMANSVPVAIASDQSAISTSATQSGTWNINNISGTVSLPTGASTSALQTTGNTSLSSIDGKLVSQALNYGAASGALRVAAQIGNASAVADFNAGNASAQTLRTVIATDQAAVKVRADTATYTGSISGVGTIIASTDVSAYKNLYVQTSITDNDNAIEVQGSNDNVNFVSVFYSDIGNYSPVPSIQIHTSSIFYIPVTFKFMKVIESNYITGTDTVNIVASTEDAGIPQVIAVVLGALVGVNLGMQASLDSIDSKTAQQNVDFGAASDGLRTASLIGVGSTAVSDSNPVPISNAPRSMVLKYRNSYSSVNVTTSAYVQVTASTSAALNKCWIFDSSGSAIIFATGAAASEVDLFYSPPGGFDTPIQVNIPASTRISIKALDVSATSGQLILNCTN